jgi:hypothetical protein
VVGLELDAGQDESTVARPSAVAELETVAELGVAAENVKLDGAAHSEVAVELDAEQDESTDAGVA